MTRYGTINDTILVNRLKEVVSITYSEVVDLVFRLFAYLCPYSGSQSGSKKGWLPEMDLIAFVTKSKPFKPIDIHI